MKVSHGVLQDAAKRFLVFVLKAFKCCAQQAVGRGTFRVLDLEECLCNVLVWQDGESMGILFGCKTLQLLLRNQAELAQMQRVTSFCAGILNIACHTPFQPAVSEKNFSTLARMAWSVPPSCVSRTRREQIWERSLCQPNVQRIEPHQRQVDTMVVWSQLVKQMIHLHS